MRIGIHYGSSTNFASVIDEVVAFEEAGADVVWLGESYGYDAVSALGALAALTTRMQIGSSILAVQTRTPSLMAMTAAGLDALSGGRMHLGLGVSGPQVIEGFHNEDFGPPLARTRALISTCRQIWRRERLETRRLRPSGMPYKDLKIMQHPVRSEIPISIAAVGDKNTALAAEIADGWIPIFFWPERHKNVWGEALAEGGALRESALGPLEIITSAVVAIGPEADETLARHRANLAHYIGGMGTRETNFYNRLLIRYGYEYEAGRISEFYATGRKDEAADLVPDDLVTGTAISGTPADISIRLQAYVDAGVTTLNLNPQGKSIEVKAEQLAMLRNLVDNL